MRLRPSPLVIIATLALGVLFLKPVLVTSQTTTPAPLSAYQVGKEKSGFIYLDAPLRAMQNDDFSNPGYLWVQKGQALWSSADGTNGKSCQTCHSAAETSMRGVGARYPAYDAKSGKVIDLEQRINEMRVDMMGAKPYKWESPQLLALTTYVKLQSRGMPVDVTTTGPAHAAWVAGKTFYDTPRGQLGMSCEMCHVQHAGDRLRSDTLSQGQTNGFPTYRLKWQAVGSVQRRFRGCNAKVRAQPLPFGSQQYVDLELYVASRGQGLPIETPSVRR